MAFKNLEANSYGVLEYIRSWSLTAFVRNFVNSRKDDGFSSLVEHLDAKSRKRQETRMRRNLPDMNRPFLILQLRPETEASDSEYAAIQEKGGLTLEQTRRIRLDRESVPTDLRLDEFAGIIVGGGPGCVSDPPESKSPDEARIESVVLEMMAEITGRDLPFLGCCYGIGILAHHLGGIVTKERYSEPIGETACALTEEGRRDPLLLDCPDRFNAFVGHKEAVQTLPPGAVHLVSSGSCPYQMIRHGKNVYATQFHPEADAAEIEMRILTYRNHGYFPPDDADRLIEMCHAADVHAPESILRRFVERYG